MYRILKLNESSKLQEKDVIQDYKDYCKDKNLDSKEQSSKDAYIKDFSKWYAQYNGLSTLKAAKEKAKAELDNLNEDIEEHDLSKDLYGDEANKRANGDQKAYEKYLQFARDIKNGKLNTVSLDSAKSLLKNAYIKVKGYYSFEPEEIDKRIAKDIPDLFGNELDEGEHLKANRNFIEELIKAGALDDINELKDEKAFNDAVDYWVDHYFDDYSDVEKEEAKEDGITDDVIRDLGIEPGSDEESTLHNLYNESHKLTEASIDDEIQDKLEDQSEEEEKEEEIEDTEENQEETVDSEEDQDENPIEEESLLDTQLDELRDILVDLDDIRLYKIISQDYDEFYILGKVSDNSDDVEMLVDTQPINFEGKEDSDEEINPEDLKQKFQFVTLPLQFDQIKDMNPRYGEDLEPNHDEIVSYLMNLLVEQNPEAAEEHKEEKVEIKEPEDEESFDEIIPEKEDEDEE